MHPTSDESVECVPGSLGSGKDRKDTESSEELERDEKFIHFTSLSMKNVRMKNIAVNKKSVRYYKVTSACEFCIHVYTCIVLHVYNDIKLLQGETSNNPSSYKPG